MAIAIVVDATVVRILLVPATMRLVGRANWYAPPGLRRLYARYGVRESDSPVSAAPPAAPAAAPAAAVAGRNAVSTEAAPAEAEPTPAEAAPAEATVGGDPSSS
jgi:RND superfamily putative drug exporter